VENREKDTTLLDTSKYIGYGRKIITDTILKEAVGEIRFNNRKIGT